MVLFYLGSFLFSNHNDNTCIHPYFAFGRLLCRSAGFAHRFGWRCRSHSRADARFWHRFSLCHRGRACIATSSGSGSAYVKEGITNIRLGMFLEIATTIGAVCGAAVAIYLNNNVIAVIYGCVLLLTAAMQQRRKSDHEGVQGSEMARRLKLFGSWPQKDGTVKSYELRNVGGGFGVMYIAGVLSGILGIGSGVLKVLAMDGLMKVPFKVSTTTSNFMMGVTACASAVFYVQRGIIEPGIACPVMIGVLLGALTGARLLKSMNVSVLRQIFCVAITLVAINMIWQGLAGQY